MAGRRRALPKFRTRCNRCRYASPFALAGSRRRSIYLGRTIMAKTSRFPGFYKVTVAERRAVVSEATGVGAEDIEQATLGGGLDAETADKFVENVLGTYGLPYGVCLNVRVNGRDCVVPMVVEEPSVVAA